MAEQSAFLETVEDWAKLYFFRSLTDFFNFLKNSELSLLQGYALAYLFFKGPIKISDLCDHMMVSLGAGSQMVDRLEKLAMVQRIADPNDRRIRKILVSDKGKTFVSDNFKFSQTWLSELPTNITEDQEKQITEALSILIESFHND